VHGSLKVAESTLQKESLPILLESRKNKPYPWIELLRCPQICGKEERYIANSAIRLHAKKPGEIYALDSFVKILLSKE